jgi:hypothetical protein
VSEIHEQRPLSKMMEIPRLARLHAKQGKRRK